MEGDQAEWLAVLLLLASAGLLHYWIVNAKAPAASMLKAALVLAAAILLVLLLCALYSIVRYGHPYGSAFVRRGLSNSWTVGAAVTAQPGDVTGYVNTSLGTPIGGFSATVGSDHYGAFG